MRVRYEAFGGIIALDEPPAMVYVDRAYMRELGFGDTSLWHAERSHLVAPVTTHFAVTHRCPMACHVCYNSSGAAPTGEMSTVEAKRVLDILATMQVFTVAFGGGEPLIRSDLFELAKYARQLGIVPTLTTNGFYMDRRTARRCRVFSHVHVSMDGIGEGYIRARGVDGFEHASRALRLLSRSRVSVGVNCVVSRANFDHVADVARFVAGMGVRDVMFLRLKPSGRANPLYQRMRLTHEQSTQLYPLISEITHRYGLRSHVDCAMMPFVYWHHPDEQALRLFAAEGCVGANEIAEIGPGGEVRACSFAASTAGNALSFPEVWDSNSAFGGFRNWLHTAQEPCLSCEYLSLCRGGCHSVSEALTGNPHAPDPECPFVFDRRE